MNPSNLVTKLTAELIGTFLLTFRDIEKWYHSITNWPPSDNDHGPRMSDGLRHANITGLPPGVGNNVEEFGTWFCGHVRRVREVVGRDDYPQHRTLIEIDIDDPNAGAFVADAFDVDEGCWGRRNVNVKLHPEEVGGAGRRSDPHLPWLVRGRKCIRGRTKMRPRRTEPLPLLPGVPPWLSMVNDTCDDEA